VINVGDAVVAEWTWGGHRFQATGVVTKVSGKTVKVRLTEHAGEHFAPGFVVTTQAQNVRKEGNMKTATKRSVQAPRMDSFTRAYFETALWSSTDESNDQGGDPLDDNYSIDDISPETRTEMISDCADFQERYSKLLVESGMDFSRAGHNFWLSRNGHGAGFFDDDQDELQEAAKSYGEFTLYVGDDGQIHGTPLSGHRAVRAPRVVRDFNKLDDLVAHAKNELGATHIVSLLIRGTGEGETKLYFPRGGQYPYEEARVWRKGGYWHAEGPGARTGVTKLPDNAMPIAQYGNPRRSSGYAPGRAAEPRFKLGAPRPGTSVRDYEAVDNRGRRIAGPSKSYSDMKRAAGTGGHVKFVRPGASEAKRGGDTRGLKQAEAAGNKYGFEQIESDHFRDWVFDQLIEASKMDPDQVLPLETKADAMKIAGNMLQQLGWDTRRDLRANDIERMAGNGDPAYADAFYEGFDHALESSKDWLADELLEMKSQIRSRTSEARRRPKAKRSARKKQR
jgi:hypothetical protein